MQRIQQRARQEEKPVTVVGVNAHRGCVHLLQLVEQWLCTSAVTYVANCVKQSPKTRVCIDSDCPVVHTPVGVPQDPP